MSVHGALLFDRVQGPAAAESVGLGITSTRDYSQPIDNCYSSDIKVINPQQDIKSTWIYPTCERTSHRCFATDVFWCCTGGVEAADIPAFHKSSAYRIFYPTIIVDLNDIPDNVIIMEKGKTTDVSSHYLAPAVLLCSYRPAPAFVSPLST